MNSSPFLFTGEECALAMEGLDLTKLPRRTFLAQHLSFSSNNEHLPDRWLWIFLPLLMLGCVIFMICRACQRVCFTHRRISDRIDDRRISVRPQRRSTMDRNSERLIPESEYFSPKQSKTRSRTDQLRLGSLDR